MEEMKKMNDAELNEVNGGNDGMSSTNWLTAVPNVESGYLALRSRPSYNEANEIAEIYPGSYFSVNTFRWNGSYVWARYNGIQGWVNADFITIL